MNRTAHATIRRAHRDRRLKRHRGWVWPGKDGPEIEVLSNNTAILTYRLPAGWNPERAWITTQSQATAFPSRAAAGGRQSSPTTAAPPPN